MLKIPHVYHWNIIKHSRFPLSKIIKENQMSYVWKFENDNDHGYMILKFKERYRQQMLIVSISLNISNFHCQKYSKCNLIIIIMLFSSSVHFIQERNEYELLITLFAIIWHLHIHWQCRWMTESSNKHERKQAHSKRKWNSLFKTKILLFDQNEQKLSLFEETLSWNVTNSPSLWITKSMRNQDKKKTKKNPI